MPRSKHRKKPARSRSSRQFAGSGHFNLSIDDQKMSEVILEFIKPYRNLAPDDAALEKLIGLGVVAWNISLLPNSERENALDQLVTDLFRRRTPRIIKKLSNLIGQWIGVGQRAKGEAERAEVKEFKQIVFEMVEHKHRRFARNRRFIISYYVEIEGEDVQIFVASTLEDIETKGKRV